MDEQNKPKKLSINKETLKGLNIQTNVKAGVAYTRDSTMCRSCTYVSAIRVCTRT